jgi:uncharacterized protein
MDRTGFGRAMNFKELNNLLIDAKAGSRAAECHGFLCGYLCLNKEVKEDIFRQYMFAEMIDTDMLNECSKKLNELATEVIAGISAENFTLELLLPDDNSPLNERGAALVEWCEGFLNGLGIACLSEFDLLSAESREVIQDLYKICRLNIDNIAAEGEDEESAFMELTEYVRMGAIQLHEEFRQSDDYYDNPRILH